VSRFVGFGGVISVESVVSWCRLNCQEALFQKSLTKTVRSSIKTHRLVVRDCVGIVSKGGGGLVLGIAIKWF